MSLSAARSSRFVLLSLAALAAILIASPLPTARAVSPNIVISQVYGGGGNSGATYTNDFIELFNRGGSAVSLAGWSVQYASATGTGNFGANSTLITELPSVTLAPGQYLLIQEAQGSGGTTSLPTPDVIDASPINMGGTGGKVALVSTTTPLGCNGGSTPCNPGALAQIVDLVGWDGANFFEGSPAPVTSNSTAVIRGGGGCADTDNNASDFTARAPVPRSTVSSLNACAGPTHPTGVGTASPASLPVGGSTLLTVAVTPGQSPASTGLAVTASLGAIGGAAEQPFFDDGTNGDVTTGDLTFSFLATVSSGTTAGPKTLPATVVDAQARTGSASISLAVEPPVIAIHDIQGSGAASPYAGQTVATTGLVTGRKTNGFFLQAPDAEADADPSTSEGIFVFTSAAPPPTAAVGNTVRVTGLVQEFVPSSDPPSPPLTEIAGSPAVTLLSDGNPLPALLTIAPLDTDPAGSIEQLERLEGMRVFVESLTVVGPTQGTINETNATATSNGVFYGVLTGIARPFREPGIQTPDPLPPGSPCCVPVFDANPERLRVDSDGQPGAVPLDVTAGAVVSDIVGPLDYGFRTYTVLPDPATPPVVTGNVGATAVPDATADELTVASLNMLRFFDDVNDPDIGEPVLTPSAFASRLQKASLAIRSVLRSPDILGVQEVENLATLQALATRLDADTVAAGGSDPAYAAYLVEGNDVGGIDVGFLVRSSRVTVVDVTQEGKDETYVNPDTGKLDILNDRPPLVLRASLLSPGGFPSPLTVIVNHLRSLLGVEEDGGRVRAKRRAQAEYLANLIQARQLADPAERIVSVGDYNAYGFNDGYVDSMGTIRGTPTSFDEVVLASPDLVDPDLTNLVDTLSAGEQYSYVFDGNAEVFDHVLVSSSLLPQARALQYARVNADFPAVYFGDPTRPERLSDHDAPVAFFRFPQADLAITPSGAPDPALTGSTLTWTLGVTNGGPDAATTVAVTGTLPAGTTFRSLTHPSGWTCTVPPVGGGGGFTCTTPGFAAGAAETFTLELDVECDLPSGTVLTSSASIAARTDDPDASDNSATATVTVSNPPPAVSGVAATPPLLWPPNHRMVDVGMAYVVTDNCGLPACRLSVASSEPVNGTGDGDTAPDWLVVDEHTVRLRAERAGGGNGRVYSITVTCADAGGGETSKTATVRVPHSQRN